MFCSECGCQISNGSNFCPNCGRSVQNNSNAMRSVSMKCSKCNADMMIDREQNILFCPYCDSKEEIPESDAIRLARMQKEEEDRRREHELEIDRLETEWNEKERKRLLRIKLIGGILMTLSTLSFILGIQYLDHSNSTNSMITLIVPQILMIVGIVFVAQKKRKRK